MNRVEMIAQAANSDAIAFWYETRRRGILRSCSIGPREVGEVRIAALWSAISRGTERLVFEGLVPKSEYERMRAPMQLGDFPFPVKYGYCAVGRVEEGPDEWLGRNVFVMHPHQDRFNAPVSSLYSIPDHIPARRATLAAILETALNAVWDSAAGPGDKIVIIGAGAVGLLIAALCVSLSGAEVTVADVLIQRKHVAENFGASFVHLTGEYDDIASNADVVFHTSGSPAGLELALKSAGFEAMIVEVSWYGGRPVTISLGESFHSKRLKLISSQVGHVSASRRSRWNLARRMNKAIALLADARFDQLITGEIDFSEMPKAISGILSASSPELITLVRY